MLQADPSILCSIVRTMVIGKHKDLMEMNKIVFNDFMLQEFALLLELQMTYNY